MLGAISGSSLNTTPMLYRYDVKSHPGSFNHVFECVSERAGRGVQVQRQALCGPAEAELSLPGECPRSAAPAHAHHGCVCLQAAEPSVRQDTTLRRRSRWREEAAAGRQGAPRSSAAHLQADGNQNILACD